MPESEDDHGSVLAYEFQNPRWRIDGPGTWRSSQGVWRIVGRWLNEDGSDHCPGGCYQFTQDGNDTGFGKFHAPVSWFWRGA